MLQQIKNLDKVIKHITEIVDFGFGKVTVVIRDKTISVVQYEKEDKY